MLVIRGLSVRTCPWRAARRVRAGVSPGRDRAISVRDGGRQPVQAYPPSTALTASSAGGLFSEAPAGRAWSAARNEEGSRAPGYL